MPNRWCGTQIRFVNNSRLLYSWHCWTLEVVCLVVVMGTILILKATDVPLEQLAEVAAWRLSDERKRALKTDDVEKLHIVDGAHAKPTWQLEDRLKKYKSLPNIDLKELSEEIVSYSVNRAIQIYCGYWNMFRVDFPDTDSDITFIERRNATIIDYRKDLDYMKDHKTEIDAMREFKEQTQKDLSETFHRAILPEFDRLDVHLGVIERKIDVIEGVTKQTNGRMLEQGATLGQHGELLREIRNAVDSLNKKSP
jgi:hypothetical protein